MPLQTAAPIETLRVTLERVPSAVRAGIRDISPSFSGLFPFAVLVGVTIAEGGVDDGSVLSALCCCSPAART
ncbi:MAG: hypothetical protein ACXV5Q_15140 [Frankiaceae bacterium]